MPDNIPLVPKPVYAKKKKPSAAARGYGAAHKALRELVLAEQPICAECNSKWSFHLHHKDHNPQNRARTNVVGLCADCHMKLHQGGK